MAVTYVTKQSNPAASTPDDLYTIGSVSVSKIVTITICNQGAAGTFRLSRSVGGGATVAKDYLYYDTGLAGNNSITITTPYFGNTGDIWRVYASTANFSFNLDAQETT